MSTSSPSQGIPFTISSVQQSLRLVELPPELLDVLSSTTPPRLHFKACTSTTLGAQRHSSGHTDKKIEAAAAPAAAAESLHICSPTQSYQVRQISTSNSVYVLAPFSASSSGVNAIREGDGSGDGEGDDRANATALSAIAKVDTMLELLPIRHDAPQMLTQALPIYDVAYDDDSDAMPLETNEELSRFGSNSVPCTKVALFKDLPVADVELERAWREVLGVEFQGRCARSGLRMSLKVWKVVMDHFTLDGLNVAEDLDLQRLMLQSDFVASPIAAVVAETVYVHLSLGNVESAMHDGSTSSAPSIRIHRQKAVRWVGSTLLQVNCSTRSSESNPSPPSPKPIYKATFLTKWQDLLPEAWRGDVTLEKLTPGSYAVTTDGDGQDLIFWTRIQESVSGAGAGDDDDDAAAAATAASSTKVMGKRKWHEKFKGQRKEVKK